MLENDSYIHSSNETLVATIDVCLSTLSYPSVHQVFIVKKIDGTLYTIWNTLTAGKAASNYSNEEYLDVFEQVANNVDVQVAFEDLGITKLNSDELRNLDMIYIFDSTNNPRVFHNLAEMNVSNVDELLLSYNKF